MKKNDFQAQRDVIKSIAEGGPGSTRWGKGSTGAVTRTKAQISKRANDKNLADVQGMLRSPQATRITKALAKRRNNPLASVKSLDKNYNRITKVNTYDKKKIKSAKHRSKARDNDIARFYRDMASRGNWTGD